MEQLSNLKIVDEQRLLSVVYASTWDNGVVTTKAMLDLTTGEISSIEAADVEEAGDLGQLLFEEISNGDGVSAVVEKNADDRYFVKDPTRLVQFLPNGEETAEAGDIDLDAVAQWVGLHYGRNFAKDPEKVRRVWVERYAEIHGITWAAPAPAPAPAMVRVLVDLEGYLGDEYRKYVNDVAEGDPMEYDDWLAGSDIPEIVKVRDALAATQAPEQPSPELSHLDDYALLCELRKRGLVAQAWSFDDFEFIGNEDETVIALDLSDEALEKVQKLAFEQCRRDLLDIVNARANEHLGDWWSMNKDQILAQVSVPESSETAFIELELTMRSRTTFGIDKETIRVFDGQSVNDVADRTAQGYGADVVEIRYLDGTLYVGPANVDTSESPAK